MKNLKKLCACLLVLGCIFVSVPTVYAEDAPEPLVIEFDYKRADTLVTIKNTSTEAITIEADTILHNNKATTHAEMVLAAGESCSLNTIFGSYGIGKHEFNIPYIYETENKVLTAQGEYPEYEDAFDLGTVAKGSVLYLNDLVSKIEALTSLGLTGEDFNFTLINSSDSKIVEQEMFSEVYNYLEISRKESESVLYINAVTKFSVQGAKSEYKLSVTLREPISVSTNYTITPSKITSYGQEIVVDFDEATPYNISNLYIANIEVLPNDTNELVVYSIDNTEWDGKKIGKIEYVNNHTIITVSKEFMDTLKNGEYCVDIRRWCEEGNVSLKAPFIVDREAIKPEKPTVNTGDTTNILGISGLLVVSVVGITVAIKKKRYQS